MTTQGKKKVLMFCIAVLILVAVVLTYPSAKKLLSLMYTYSRPVVYGKEVMYSYIEEGDIRIADEVLGNTYEISRFSPVKIETVTWQEDPFSDLYWRFNYYNLEPVRNLLFAWEQTGDPKYKDKMIELTRSFIEQGVNGPYSWDYHGAAFRTMTLVDVREKLRQKNALPIDLDTKIVETLKMHGDFLADPAHFEKDYNHGLDQAAALYLLAVNYPDMPGADEWLKVASGRITEVLAGIIDDDGVLVENSPYYHLYVLEKFFEIDKYLQQNHLAIEGFSRDKIDKMVSYVVYMLQPNLEVPTIGASLGRQIGLAGMYKELAASRPDLLYVLTQGAYGEKPSQLNVQYPASGETIMRSGWGQREEYVNQTQLIFDAGNYRTNHSDLDALSFNLFGKGVALLPDAGLYSYEPGPYRSYFHGTRAHNTVVVDGKDQGIGNASTTNKVTAGFFEEGKGYVYQSAESNLYEGVSHERAVALIEDSTMLVIDDLKSVSEHTYEQMFHIFPGAKTSTDGLTVTAQGAVPEQSVVIRQFMTDGVEVHTVLGDQNSPDGLCSLKYNEAVPCESVSYTQKGTDVSYVTAIRIGKDKVDVRFDKENNQMVVTTDKRKYRVKIHKTDGTARRIEANKQFDVEALYSGAQPASALNALSEWKLIERTEPQTDKGSVSFNKKEKSLEMVTPVDGSLLSVGKDTDVDLSDKDLYFKIKVNQSTNLKGIDISLSNNHWEKEARYNIDEVFNYSYANREGEWLQFGAGKSYFRKANLGGWWTKVGSHFDWSKIDSIRIIARSEQGKRSVIDVKDFVLVPNQEQARAVIVFDDGWASVMDAVPSMKVYGVKGNVGVITGSVGKRSYLTLDELKTLQNEYGWDIANHSSLHKNAVNEYEKNNNMQGLESDVSDALEYLIQNDINSAPNWYVYPDGSTDGAVKGVIGKYYKFGRSTSSVITHSFPFAEPLEVGVFPVYSDRTTPAEVHDAISDAIKYDQTIFLMFHKISQGAPSMFTEISVKDFDTIVKDIHQQGIQVVTLSELDAENNVPETVFALHDATSGQLKLDVSLDRASGIFSHGILQTWEYLADLKKNIVQSLPF